MKIYTKTGDDGTTGLFGGGRVRKSEARIDCYGNVDELNAALGLARVVAQAQAGAAASIGQSLFRVQNELFVVGSHLATPEDSPHTRSLPMLDEAMVGRLEMEIDAAEAELEPLRNFILPGGGELAARLHVARTVCRRGGGGGGGFGGGGAGGGGGGGGIEPGGGWGCRGGGGGETGG